MLPHTPAMVPHLIRLPVSFANNIFRVMGTELLPQAVDIADFSAIPVDKLPPIS